MTTNQKRKHKLVAFSVWVSFCPFELLVVGVLSSGGTEQMLDNGRIIHSRAVLFSGV